MRTGLLRDLLLAALGFHLLAACSETDKSRTCTVETHCVQGGVEGRCTVAPGGDSYCAYPDPVGCDSGLRWGVAAGEDLAGACVETAGAADGGAADAALADAAPLEPSTPWLRTFAGALDERAHAVAADPEGNLFVSGGSAGTTDFGSGHVSPGSAALYLAKLTGAGSTTWVKTFAAAPPWLPEGSRLASAPDGSVFLALVTFEPIDLGTGPVAPGVVVARFGPAGAVLWARSFGDPDLGDISLDDLDVTPTGDVVVAIGFTSELSVGGRTHQVAQLGMAFLHLAATDGGHVWSRAIDPQADARPAHVAVVGNTLLVAAAVGGPVDLGGGVLSPVGAAGRDTVVVAYDLLDHAHRWSRRMGGEGHVEPLGLAGHAGTLALVATCASSCRLGAHELASSVPQLVQARYAADGQHVHSARIAALPQSLRVRDVTLAADGLWLAGDFEGILVTPARTLVSAGQEDALVVHVDGATIDARRYGAAGRDHALGVDVSGGDRLLVGDFEGTVEFDGFSATGSGVDAFVLRGPR